MPTRPLRTTIGSVGTTIEELRWTRVVRIRDNGLPRTAPNFTTITRGGQHENQPARVWAHTEWTREATDGQHPAEDRRLKH